jgi:hypothetical protein
MPMHHAYDASSSIKIWAPPYSLSQTKEVFIRRILWCNKLEHLVKVSAEVEEEEENMIIGMDNKRLLFNK